MAVSQSFQRQGGGPGQVLADLVSLCGGGRERQQTSLRDKLRRSHEGREQYTTLKGTNHALRAVVYFFFGLLAGKAAS
jgi:hypothetical protein